METIQLQRTTPLPRQVQQPLERLGQPLPLPGFVSTQQCAARFQPYTALLNPLQIGEGRRQAKLKDLNPDLLVRLYRSQALRQEAWWRWIFFAKIHLHNLQFSLCCFV